MYELTLIGLGAFFVVVAYSLIGMFTSKRISAKFHTVIFDGDRNFSIPATVEIKPGDTVAFIRVDDLNRMMTRLGAKKIRG